MKRHVIIAGLIVELALPAIPVAAKGPAPVVVPRAPIVVPRAPMVSPRVPVRPPSPPFRVPPTAKPPGSPPPKQPPPPPPKQPPSSPPPDPIRSLQPAPAPATSSWFPWWIFWAGSGGKKCDERNKDCQK